MNSRLSSHRNNAKHLFCKVPAGVRTQYGYVYMCKCLCVIPTFRHTVRSGIGLPLTLLPTFNLLMSQSKADSAAKSSGKLISRSSDTSLLPRWALTSNFPLPSHIVLNNQHMSQGGNIQCALLRSP